MILLDVGVWLAAAWARHVHHGPAAVWMDAQEDPMLKCRVTQMGLLRLLSNSAVMGEDATSRRGAWTVVDQFRSDDRVTWVAEPAGLEHVWRSLSARRDRSHRLWTDDYLAAFAQAGGYRLATLDRRLGARYPSVEVETVR
jgi:toxin-antitoxin system PIN domain toxin